MRKRALAVYAWALAGFSGCAASGPAVVVARLRVDRVEEAAGIYFSPEAGERPLVLYYLVALDAPSDGETLVLHSMDRKGRWGNEHDVILLRYRGRLPINGELEPSLIVTYEKLRE